MRIKRLSTHLCKYIFKRHHFKPNFREVERQLIDNILAPTGITTKPSDFQLKDFLNRTKNLNKDTITSLLHERLVQFDESQDIKPLQVSKCYLF